MAWQKDLSVPAPEVYVIIDPLGDLERGLREIALNHGKAIGSVERLTLAEVHARFPRSRELV